MFCLSISKMIYIKTCKSYDSEALHTVIVDSIKIRVRLFRANKNSIMTRYFQYMQKIYNWPCLVFRETQNYETVSLLQGLQVKERFVSQLVRVIPHFAVCSSRVALAARRRRQHSNGSRSRGFRISLSPIIPQDVLSGRTGPNLLRIDSVLVL